MFFLAHVNEVIDDHAPQIPQTQLAGDLLGRGEVELVGGFLGRVLGAEISAVDVDCHERFGLVNDDRAAAGKRHLALVDPGDFRLELVLVEQRLASLVQLQVADEPGHDQLKELLGPFEGRRLIDVDRIDVGREDIADRADDQVAFLVDIHGRGAAANPAHDDLPQAQQIGHIAGQFFLGAVLSGGADDEPEPLGRIQFEQVFAQTTSSDFVLDLS